MKYHAKKETLGDEVLILLDKTDVMKRVFEKRETKSL
jgi:hypothetical protein